MYRFFVIMIFTYSFGIIRAAAYELIDHQSYKKIIGYDIKIIGLTDNDYIKNVYVPGLAESHSNDNDSNQFSLTNKIVCDVPHIRKFLSERATHSHIKSFLNLLSLLQSISFGQDSEIIPTVFTLATIIKKHNAHGNNQEKCVINLICNSRGGLLGINTLAALYQTPPQIDVALQKLAIDNTCKEDILAAIQRGSIVLYQPLRDFKSLVEEHITERIDYILRPPFLESFHIMYGWIGILASRFLIKFTLYVLLPMLTAYRPWRSDFATSCDIIRSKYKSHRFLFLPQLQDTIVLAHDLKAYVSQLPAEPKNIWIVPQKQGGHDSDISKKQKNAVGVFLRGVESKKYNKYISKYTMLAGEQLLTV